MNIEYDIKPVKTSKDKIKHPALAEQGVIPKLCTSTIISGGTGSGKSVLLQNLLTNKQFYGGHFARTVLISPTGLCDDVQKAMGVKKSMVFTDLKEGEEALDVLEKHQSSVVENTGQAPITCVVMDDCVTDRPFLNSSAFNAAFMRARHNWEHVFFLTQHYKAVPKKAREQAACLIFFKMTKADAEQLYESHAPPGLSKRGFVRMCEDVMASAPYAFLTINTTCDWSTRFRRGLAMVIDLEQYRDENLKSLLQDKQDNNNNQNAETVRGVSGNRLRERQAEGQKEGSTTTKFTNDRARERTT